MTAARTLALIGLVGLLLACRENIPRPPDELEDGGPVVPADVSMPDGAGPGPDAAPDLPPPPTCGTGGQPCCPGNVCTGGGCCMSGQCIANGTACRSDATCLEGSCGGCGAILPMAQGCCEARVCTASRAVCAGPGAGSSHACGAGGQGCCGDDFCQPGFTCDKNAVSSGLCVPK
jgi:hypothetical protein